MIDQNKYGFLLTLSILKTHHNLVQEFELKTFQKLLPVNSSNNVIDYLCLYPEKSPLFALNR